MYDILKKAYEKQIEAHNEMCKILGSPLEETALTAWWNKQIEFCDKMIKQSR